MDPPCQRSEEEIRNKCAKDSKDHDVLNILEESLTAHVVAGCEHNRGNAEVEKDIVIENNVLLDRVVVALEGSKTDKEANSRYIAGLMSKRRASCILDRTYHQITDDEEEH